MLALRRSLGLLYVLVALGLFPSLGAAQSQIKPWFLFIVDTSGSMTSSAPANSCGYTPANRINAAKCAVYNVVSSSGDADFGLLTFNESTSCSTSNCTDTGPAGQVRVNIGAGAYSVLAQVDNTGTGPANELCTGGYTPIGGTLMRAQDYLRGATSPTINDPAIGCRPINVILLTDGSECCGACANGWGDCTDFEAAFSGDPDCPGGDCTCDAGCFTTASCDAEGFESGPERAHHLFGNTWVPPTSGDTCTSSPRTNPPADADCVKLDIRTYVIGFGNAISPGDQYIERLAIAGRTDNPDPSYRGFYASNETQLSAALTQIILDSQIVEVCDGIDNDCDARVDEDYPKYCDINDIRTTNPMVTNPLDPGGPLIDQADVVGPLGDVSNLAGCDAQSGCDVPGEQENPACSQPEWSSSSTCSPPNILCASPGEECNIEDDDCDGAVDENAPALVCPCCGVQACEPCDLVDNDCDGKVDENTCPPCFPEICDNLDNDCDGIVDDGLTRSCGTDVGECTAGQQVCQDPACLAAVPFDPSCLCDTPPCWGAVNPMTMSWEYGFCPSAGPFTELCNNLDDNCDGVIDRIQQPCSPYGTTGECEPGTEMCIGGVWQYSHDAGTGDDVPANCVGARGPTIEICDTQDDDCDGDTDEYNPGAMPPELLPGVGLTCGNGLGICDPGQTVCASVSTCPDCFGGKCTGSLASCTVDGTCAECTAGTVVCQDDDDSMTEVCNGLDDDCDGKIDENPGGNSLPDVGVDCYPVDPGSYPPPPYTGACDGSDPACLDLGVTAMPLGICSEGTSACLGGNIVCQNWTGPQPELCDSIDQDCNGNPVTVLNDPIVGQTCGSSVGVCDPGTYGCNLSTEMIECSADPIPGELTEVCNGEDDDCDGKVDEMTDTLAPCDYDPGNDPALIPQEGLCTHGVTRCVGGEEVCDGAVGPSPEICDCDDNDCDGNSDEYDPGAMPPKLIPGVGEDCGTDVGICETGTTICDSNTCGIECPDDTEPCNGTMPCNELCNALDDDCDGLTDEDNPEGGAQCGNVGPCRRSTDPDSGGTLDQPCGECRFGTEICTPAAQAGGACGTDLACLVCIGHVGPEDEQCNGLDDDCDYPCLDVDPFDAIPPNCPANPCGLPTNDPGYLDCDSKVDEGVDVTDPEVGELCGDPTGECDEGMFVCLDGVLECQGATGPVPETCNMKDDDCDTRTDEGIPVGNPCGTDVGECQPGVQTCDRDTGMLVCTGGVQPIPEVCDSLDNDCDGSIDEELGLGDVCGTNVGECMEGQLQCVAGKVKCVGEIPPGIEICDCLDNDCDGNVDEEAGANPICPGTSACIMCQCALPCIVLPEFGNTCPQGKAPLTMDGQCYCVGAACNPAECAAETQTSNDGTVLCGPNEDLVGTCACKNNACTFRCSGVDCPQGLVCDPVDGACREANCLLPQFACPEDEVCQSTDGIWDCVADPCAGANCAADEACRDGDCVGSCAKVSCPSGDMCVDGACVKDECAGVSCGPGLLCNPADGECVVPGACVKSGCASGEVCEPIGGECVSDPCLVTRCPIGERCDSATSQCESRCGPGFLFCGDACIDPQSSKTNCGASGDCTGDNAGATCADEEVCSEGTCGTECASGLVNCGGECINPNTDRNHCGASGECTGAGAGTTCETGKSCRNGACIDNSMIGVDAGDGSGVAGPMPDTETRVIAAGGGGCKCAVPGSAVPAAGGTRAGAFAWLLVGLALLRLRRRRLAAGFRALPRGMGLGLVAILAALPGEGCKVEPFCLTCPPEGTAGTGPSEDGGGAGSGMEDGGGAGAGGTSGGTNGGGGDGGPLGDGGGTGGMGGRDGGECLDVELCNDVDDDCDGTVNEDVDPAAQNIDLDTDLFNCGECGDACAPVHAIGKCVGGTCGVDLCDVGWYDLDGKPENGCEYSCFKLTSDDSVCDLRDDDCDGSIDEDIDLETDIENCGSCGFECVFIHAADGASCEQGDCVLDPTSCDPGFHDVDGNPLNGCEYSCTPASPAVELCNATDDDCDKKVDEGVAATDPLIGVACPGGTNTGPCNAGTTVCTGGAVQCQGGIGPTEEVCDGIDNDCNSAIDEDDPRLGLACGSSIGACERGNLTCELVSGNKELVCTGGVLPAASETCNGSDDDCDGKTDEAPVVSVNAQCRTASNGSLLINPGPPTGLCVNGLVACQQSQLKCVGETKPSPEQCDALDQDCDGNPINGVATTDPDIGKPCGRETGECVFGTTLCNSGVQVCSGGVTPQPEICDGLDNDCDGVFDNQSHVDPDDPLSPLDPETPYGIGLSCKFPLSPPSDPDCVPVAPLEFCYGNDVVVAGECVVGTTTCVGGRVACPDYVGPTPEKCDADDQDCDGDPANGVALTDNAVGAACDTDANTTGICNSGTTVCNTSGPTPIIQCTGEVFPNVGGELCDGVDNDCDGLGDDGQNETWITTPTTCKTNLTTGAVELNPVPVPGICSLGTPVCITGALQCQGEIFPIVEICDGAGFGQAYNSAHDQDCDLKVDEDFALGDNAQRCGTCSNDCTTIDANANWLCTNGVCDISSCKQGYFDDKTVPGEDCSIGPGDCTFTGAEICDATDNDCDGNIDEDIVGEPLNLPDAAAFCPQQGACAGSDVECRTHLLGDPDADAPADCPLGYSDPGCVTEPVCTIRPTDEVCDAPWNMETASAYDNNCNGLSDQAEFGLTAACLFTGPGVFGACQTSGNLACDTSMGSVSDIDTYCDNGAGAPVAAGTPGNESICNGTDDDCDDNVDEACGYSTDMNCVDDAWVTLPVTGTEIYAYEASRLDATSGGSGSKTDRACSVVGRLPWGNVTWQEAQDACLAADPDGRLCTEQEWQEACEYTGATACTWSFSNMCTVYGTTNDDTCNGLDFAASGNDLEPTGWTGLGAMTSGCYRPRTGGNLFDMSGNVREYVDGRLDGALPVRGGANNSPSSGMTCQFNFSVWPDTDTAKFFNTGFRCCRGTPPPRCGTFVSTNLPANGNNSDITTSFVVPALPGSPLITDVKVMVGGFHTDFESVELIRLRSPELTDVALHNVANVCTSGVDGFQLRFDDAATPTSPSCTAPVGNYIWNKPDQPLSAFDGETPSGTWELYLDDTELNDGAWYVDTFTLIICAQ